MVRPGDLGAILHFSLSQFSHLENGDHDSTHLTESLRWLKEWWSVKCSGKHPGQGAIIWWWPELLSPFSEKLPTDGFMAEEEEWSPGNVEWGKGTATGTSTCATWNITFQVEKLLRTASQPLIIHTWPFGCCKWCSPEVANRADEAPHSAAWAPSLHVLGEQAARSWPPSQQDPGSEQLGSRLHWQQHHHRSHGCHGHTAGFEETGVSYKACSASDDLVQGSSVPWNVIIVTNISHSWATSKGEGSPRLSSPPAQKPLYTAMCSWLVHLQMWPGDFAEDGRAGGQLLGLCAWETQSLV